MECLAHDGGPWPAFEESRELRAWEQAAVTLAQIQLSHIDHTTNLLATGALDWTLPIVLSRAKHFSERLPQLMALQPETARGQTTHHNRMRDSEPATAWRDRRAVRWAPSDDHRPRRLEPWKYLCRPKPVLDSRLGGDLRESSVYRL